MGERLTAYLARIDALLQDADAEVDWDRVIEEHLVQTSFFQHERLVHLLVTLAFALLELISAIATILAPGVQILVLMVLFLVLLAPYVVHYYHLENGTQRLYAQYDKLLALAAVRRNGA